ncbi:MAG: LamG-like jellyroll fold domain-containing protein, partial [Planctomycetota bacterium]
QEILDLLEDCKEQMGSRTVLGIVVSDKVKSPVLFGFIRPRLLLPVGIIETLRTEELRYVFLHELAHLKRCDILLGWLTSLLTILHWFNPLVWYAFYRMRVDRELACDGLALSTMNVDEPPKYGRTIVGLLERFSRVRYVPGMVGILETKVQLERRITMIAKFKKGSQRIKLLAVLLIVMMACVSLTDARRVGGMVSTGGGSFEGTWSGMAVDKPEDGTSRDPLTIKMVVNENDQLAGEAFGSFVSGGHCRLENLKVAGSQISFEVTHRFRNMRMGITLELRDGKLQGEGIPIGIDEDRCDITLRRESSAGPGGYTAPMPGIREAILYYSFDRDEGQTVTDKSGQGRCGSVHGARYETNGRIGGAFSFDGEDDYISVQNVNLKEFSFSAWVKASNSEGSIIRGGDNTRTRSVSTGARMEFRPRGLSINNSRVFTLGDGMHYYALQGNVRGGLSIVADGEEINEYDWQFAANAWTHLTLTHEAGSFKLYKDGQLTEAGHMSSSPVAGTLYIGGTSRHGGDFWQGMIDEVAVFNRALSEEEVRRLHGRFVAAKGTGEAVGGRWINPDRPGVGAGKALRFNGESDFVLIPSSRSLDIRGSLTLSAWVKNEGDNDGQIIWRGDARGGHDPYELHVAGGRMEFRIDAGSDAGTYTEYRVRPRTPVDDAWHFWTGVYDKEAGRIYLYKDGVLENSSQIDHEIGYDTYSMWNVIGAVDHGTWQHFRGIIDEVRVWNVARTQQQIERAMHRSLSGSESGLVGYWKFDEGSGDIARDSSPYRNDGQLRTSGDRTISILSTPGPAVVSPPFAGATTGLDRFAGTWSGMAVDKPEDGTSRDRLRLDFRIDENGQLVGEAAGEFVRYNDRALKNIRLRRNQLEFEVKHRTGIRMAITLEPIGDKLQGGGIPIDGDEQSDRCDISLERKSAGGGARATTGVKKKG